jgi:hypothetical protein
MKVNILRLGIKKVAEEQGEELLKAESKENNSSMYINIVIAILSLLGIVFVIKEAKLYEKRKQNFYAYSIGNIKGITDNWPECQSIVSGKEAKYKSFETKEEAERWLEAGQIIA